MALSSRIALFLIIAGVLIQSCMQKKIKVLTVPAGNLPTVIRTDGSAILPSGRFLTPAGQLIRITEDPFGLALYPDGKKADRDNLNMHI